MNCSPGGGGGNSCIDSNQNCAAWQREGYCTEGQYVDWMATNCPKSCGKCPTTTTTTTTRPQTTKTPTVEPPVECEDKHKNCNYWSGQNFCTEGYVDYMVKNCPKSCGMCKSLLKFLIIIKHR